MPCSSQYLNAIKPDSQVDLLLVSEAAADCFTYHPWSTEQIEAGNKVRAVLQSAFETIIAQCPPSADRSCALRKIREARMDANSAITHQGRY